MLQACPMQIVDTGVLSLMYLNEDGDTSGKDRKIDMSTHVGSMYKTHVIQAVHAMTYCMVS
jgi:hypothetical protein